MSTLSTNSKPFEVFITSVDKFGPLLKIWGQCDRVNSMYIEQLLLNAYNAFENNSALQLSQLQVNKLCCAKYKDGSYYRARITSVRNVVSGFVEVKFIDYGNSESIPLKNIRMIDHLGSAIIQMKPQATDFVLANIVAINHQWDEKTIAFVQDEIANTEMKCTILTEFNNLRFVKIQFHDTDLAEYLIRKGIATQIPLTNQITRLNNLIHPQNSNMHVQQHLPVQQAMHQPLDSSMYLAFKPLQLEPNSEHMVYVSYVEDGPFLFSIQLQSMETNLANLMIEMNNINNLLPLTVTPVPGFSCMARCSEDNSLCRSVVINLVEDKLKIFFVDFGNSDVLPFSKIFHIPNKFMLPKVMSMRYTLHGLKNIKINDEMKCAFKEFVTDRLLKLKVIQLENSPAAQYCELYDEENRNIIELLYAPFIRYKTLDIYKNSAYNIVVSFVECCSKIYVQLKEYSEELNNLMTSLATASEGSPALDSYEPGMPCIAFYSGDSQWYRAEILNSNHQMVTVRYVDYGNQDTVPFNCLKKIDPKFISFLPAQAIECCLFGYQNMSFNPNIGSAFESLTLEKEFTMKVVNKQGKTNLIDLFDKTGTTVAALLLERLASGSDSNTVVPLPTNRVTKYMSTISNEENEPPPNAAFIDDPRSVPDNTTPPKDEQQSQSWRNTERNRDKKDRKTFENDKRGTSQKKFDDNKSWRNNNKNSSPNNREKNFNNWNSESPMTIKRHDRDRNQDNESSYDKGRSDKFQNRFRPGRGKTSPLQDSGRGNSTWNSGSESEKSWSGNSTSNRSGKSVGVRREFNNGPKRNSGFTKTRDFGDKPSNFSANKSSSPPPDYVPLDTPFTYQNINPGDSNIINISWYYDPEHFFCQFTSSTAEFKSLMNDIQSTYSRRKPINNSVNISVGASVIAEFLDDGILYRATVVEAYHPKYVVQYVDFGNKGRIDINKIWQVENKFINLPVQAIKCSLHNVKSTNKTWPITNQLDHIFNKPTFVATFIQFDGDKYDVQLCHNDLDVKVQLIEHGFALDASAAVEISDTPVDINVLLNQNMTVNISFVENLSKFYVQLEEEKLTHMNESITNYIKSIGVEALTKLTENLLVVGTNCLVQCETNNWRRGIISNTSDSKALIIDYPDFGGNKVHKPDELYALPSELCAYWYQAYECTLHNLNENVTKKITDKQFKKMYETTKVILYIDDVESERLIVSLYDLAGVKADLFEPDERAYPTISPICPLPIFNGTLNVWVSHVENINSIFVQRDCDGGNIQTLLDSLANHYETNGEPLTMEAIKVDSIYACKSVEDGNWYRARVDSFDGENPSNIVVHYVDYGNKETLPVDNIKELDLNLFRYHEYALQVGLSLQSDSENVTDEIKKLATDQMFTATIYYGDAGWIVELSNNTVNINKKLVESGLASVAVKAIEESVEPIAEEEEIAEIEKAEITDTSLATTVTVDCTATSAVASGVETRTQICITHIDSPSEFYVQLLANEQLIETLQANLQENVTTQPDLDGADVGVLCAAKYTVDEQWYRAEVLDADTEITTVRFIDYGNTDVITNAPGSIKTLPADLLAIDKYARKCSLNVMPVTAANKDDDYEWSKEALKMFEMAVNVDALYADIVYQDEKNKTFVELYVPGNAAATEKSIAQMLIDAQLAIPITRDVEDNIANNTGFVSHLNSASEFWIQLESSVADLEMIADRLTGAETFPKLSDFRPGVLCAAKFPDDDMWYRARILSCTVAGIEVLFIDYGNSSTAIELKVLPEDLVQLPPLAQKCSLNRPANIALWSAEANDKFSEISSDGLTIFTVRKLTPGETTLVELYWNNTKVTDELVPLCNNENTQTATGESEQKREKVCISYVESPKHFWVQLHSDAGKIDEMMSQMVAAADYDKLDKFDPDVICAAYHAESGYWYRANIYESTETGSHEVLLIDYGNIVITDQLHVLPESVQKLMPLAKLCTLNGADESNDYNVEKFKKILTQTSVDYRVQFLDDNIPMTVQLFVNDKDIIDVLNSDVEFTIFSEKQQKDGLSTDEIVQLAVNMQLPESAETESVESNPAKTENPSVNNLNSEQIITNNTDLGNGALLTNENLITSSTIEQTETEMIATECAQLIANIAYDYLTTNYSNYNEIIQAFQLADTRSKITDTENTIDHLTITDTNTDEQLANGEIDKTENKTDELMTIVEVDEPIQSIVNNNDVQLSIDEICMTKYRLDEITEVKVNEQNQLTDTNNDEQLTTDQIVEIETKIDELTTVEVTEVNSLTTDTVNDEQLKTDKIDITKNKIDELIEDEVDGQIPLTDTENDGQFTTDQIGEIETKSDELTKVAVDEQIQLTDTKNDEQLTINQICEIENEIDKLTTVEVVEQIQLTDTNNDEQLTIDQIGEIEPKIDELTKVAVDEQIQLTDTNNDEQLTTDQIDEVEIKTGELTTVEVVEQIQLTNTNNDEQLTTSEIGELTTVEVVEENSLATNTINDDQLKTDNIDTAKNIIDELTKVEVGEQIPLTDTKNDEQLTTNQIGETETKIDKLTTGEVVEHISLTNTNNGEQISLTDAKNDEQLTTDQIGKIETKIDELTTVEVVEHISLTDCKNDEQLTTEQIGQIETEIGEQIQLTGTNIAEQLTIDQISETENKIDELRKVEVVEQKHLTNTNIDEHLMIDDIGKTENKIDELISVDVVEDILHLTDIIIEDIDETGKKIVELTIVEQIPLIDTNNDLQQTTNDIDITKNKTDSNNDECLTKNDFVKTEEVTMIETGEQVQLNDTHNDDECLITNILAETDNKHAEITQVKVVEQSLLTDSNANDHFIINNEMTKSENNLNNTEVTNTNNDEHLTANNEITETENKSDEITKIEGVEQSQLIVTNNDVRLAINQICENKIDENVEKPISRPQTPYSEKLIAGAVIGLQVDYPPDEDESICRTPTLPEEKIVPGCISRGFLETTAPSNGNNVNDVEIKTKPVVVVAGKSNDFVGNEIIIRPATPHHEKIVPGSICRGEYKVCNEFISRPATPLAEKIVPGSICRGDFSSTSTNNEEKDTNNMELFNQE